MSDTVKQPPDHAARCRAARDFDTNLVVIAGAGTGKTSLLMERALTALGSGIVEAERLAAITFTEKAAGEMQDRLAAGLERLHELAAGQAHAHERELRTARSVFEHLTAEGVEVADVARRALAGLESLDRMPVKNLHALCIDILRAWPREAGVDPRFRVDPGVLFGRLVDETWPRFLARELGPQGPREALWRRLLQRLSPRELERAARDVAEFRVPESALQASAEPIDVATLFAPVTNRLDEELSALLENSAVQAAGKTVDLLQAVRDGLRALAARGAAGLRQRVEVDASLRRALGSSSPNISKKLHGEIRKDVTRAAKEGIRLLRDTVVVDEQLASDLLEAVAPFAREVREASLARGIIGFDALLTLTRDLLRDNPVVRERVRQRYRQILVDEFQDTDPVQYEIVLFLAEKDGGREADAYAAELAPGRLCIVGDPKQSVYRFRGADHTEFMRATRRVVEQGGEKLFLTANFRSVEGVVEPINTLFTGAGSAWRPGAYQPDYVAIEATRTGEPGSPAVEIWNVDAHGDTHARERRRAEGEIIAREIARWVRRGEAEFGDITIVLRAFTNLAAYLRPLRRLGVPFIVDGGLDFLKRQEVSHFLALLRALARPDDPVALLAVLRSPVAAVDDDELARFARSHPGWTWRGRRRPDRARFPGVARAFDQLNRLADETAHLPPDRALRRVLAGSGLLPLAAAAFEGAQQVANLRKLATVAGRVVREVGLDLAGVIDIIESGRATELDSDSPMADDTGGVVQVLTVHKAKGLESPVVIVPDLARQARRPDSRAVPAVEPVRLTDGSQVAGVRVGPAVSAARAWSAGEQRLHEEAEELRVLYVALTRARDRLVLVTGPSERSSAWLDALAAWGLDSALDGDESLAQGRVLYRRVKTDEEVPVSVEERQAETAGAVTRWNEAVDRVRFTARAPLRYPTALDEDRWSPPAVEESAPAPRGRADAGQVPRASGIAMHRLLETWTGEPDTMRLAVGRIAAAAADETGAPEKAVTDDLRGLVDLFLDSDLSRRVRAVETLARELPVGVQAGDGGVWGGSIDLLYRDTGGEVVVADYKTDRSTDEAELSRRHGFQLAVYAAAVQRALGLARPPRTEIWMLRAGVVVPVDTASRCGALLSEDASEPPGPPAARP